MSDERENQLKQRAYEIWEREGRPHGRHDEHWQQAEHLEQAGQTEKGQQSVEGEGSYTAARAYDEGVRKTVESGKVPAAARDAANAVAGPEGAELRKAEEEGRRHSRGEDRKQRKGAAG